MASAAKTFSDDGGAFEVDGTERVHTLRTPGGLVSNTSLVDFVIHPWGAAISSLTDPVPPPCLPVPAGSSARLPPQSLSFSAKAGAQAFGVLTKG